MNRDQAAAGAGVARHTAKFHLDKLVDDGLLEVEFSLPRAAGDRRGPTHEVLPRAAREVSVSLPERHYELAGRLLAPARSSRRNATRCPSATRFGMLRTTPGSKSACRPAPAGKRAGDARLAAAGTEVLGECGYEPRRDADGVTLVNCPFHVLAQEYTELVCGMNLELMHGLVEPRSTKVLVGGHADVAGCARSSRAPRSRHMKHTLLGYSEPSASLTMIVSNTPPGRGSIVMLATSI